MRKKGQYFLENELLFGADMILITDENKWLNLKKGRVRLFQNGFGKRRLSLCRNHRRFFSESCQQGHMEKSSYQGLMAHGALLVGFMSTVSTMAIAHTRDAEETPVSVGYDKVRFLNRFSLEILWPSIHHQRNWTWTETFLCRHRSDQPGWETGCRWQTPAMGSELKKMNTLYLFC